MAPEDRLLGKWICLFMLDLTNSVSPSEGWTSTRPTIVYWVDLRFMLLGGVASTLHQRLKFLIDDKLVIVCREEDLLVSKLSSFIYFETDEGVVEILIHYLEFEEFSLATANHDQSSVTIISSVRSANQTLEKASLSS